MSSHQHDTIVVGGGIAGLTTAWQLARLGRGRVTLHERELQLATHSSARNAQIWLPVDDDETTGPLARRSAELWTELLGTQEQWLTTTSALVLTEGDAEAQEVVRGAERSGVGARPITKAERDARCPALTGGTYDDEAFLIEGAGVLDTDRMIRASIAAARAEGVELKTGTGVRRVCTDDRRVVGVELDDGAIAPAGRVVLAAGAWASGLGKDIGAPTTLEPLRRHLVLIDADPATVRVIVWRFGRDSVYFRPESGGVLVSPCDEEPFAPCLPTADPGALERLAEVLAPVAPELVDAPVRTSWSCLRTYTADRELVLGPDPRVPGLGWIAGLGGRGMTVGAAAGELAAKMLLGEVSDLDAHGTRSDQLTQAVSASRLSGNM